VTGQSLGSQIFQQANGAADRFLLVAVLEKSLVKGAGTPKSAAEWRIRDSLDATWHSFVMIGKTFILL
jgi:hypothetical protein